MKDPLALPLKVYRRLAAATLLLPVVLYALAPTPWLIVLEIVFFGHWASIAWVDRRRGEWTRHRVATAFCVAEWGAAVAVTAVEGWALHVTPIMCLGPVVLSTQVVDGPRYRQLSSGAVIVIAGMSVLGKLTDPGPIYQASSGTTIDVTAIVVTPVLAAVVALVAWLNQRAISDRRDQLHLSRSRLFHADEAARASFAVFARDIQAKIDHIRERLRTAKSVRQATDAFDEIQAVSGEVRNVAHGLGARGFDLDDRESVMALLAGSDVPVELELGPVGDRDHVVDSVVRVVLTDAFACVPERVRSNVRIRHEGPDLHLEVEHVTPAASGGRIDLDVLTMDRVGAIGGTERSPATDDERQRIVIDLPMKPPSVAGTGANPRDLRSDLRPGLILPISAVVAAVVVWAVVLTEPEMLSVAVQLLVLFVVPCALAVVVAPPLPRAAIAVFVGSHWVTSIVIISQLNILKYFVAIALLIPLLMSLPHVDRRAFTILTFGTCTTIAATAAIARLGNQLSIASEAPETLTNIIVVVMVPLCSAIVLHVSGANYDAMAHASADLIRSRRHLVRALDNAQRRLERDLHDGTQQRLVSAALRTQIAARLDDPVQADESVSAAVTELGRAAASLRSLSIGADPEAARAGLKSALDGLASTSPLPIDLNIETHSRELPADVQTTIWYCCTEAVANAVKHAGEFAMIRIVIRSTFDTVTFEVSDTGRGFRVTPTDRWEPVGQGLHNLYERVELAHGSLRVDSTPGIGTSIIGRIPLAVPSPNPHGEQV